LDFVSQMIGFRDAEKLKAWIDRLQELYAKARDIQAKLKASPVDAGLHRQLGDHLRDLGNLPAAIAAYEASAKISRERPNPAEEDRRFRGETLVRLTDALRSENKAGPLASLGEELCALDADGKLGYRDNGLYVLALFEHHTALEEGQPERSKKALEHLREAAAKYPDSDKGDEILLWLAVLCNDLEKDAAESEKSLTRLIDKYPESPLAEFAKKALEKIRGGGAKDPAPADPAKIEARSVVQDKYDRWRKKKAEVEAKGDLATGFDRTFVGVFEKDYLKAKEEFDAKWGERFEPK
ncbi:MAG TPA: tetratricopeptide repeat protein, partial [Planctomycetota bacterium]|nr:tetratricopeptide repeat protein [Planctomycetota bacterium]